MKALSRTALIGALAIAVSAAGLPVGSLIALAGTAAPVITNLTLTPDPSDEGQQVLLHGEFTDTDGPEDHFLVVSWGGGLALTQQSLPAGVTSFDIPKVYPDDRPTGTPFDTYDVVVTIYDGLSPDPLMPNTSQTLKHTVRDVAPTVTITLSPSPILEGQSVTATLTITDPGNVVVNPSPCTASRTPDCFIINSFSWGDGTSEPPQLTFSTTKSYTFGPHQYTVPNTYHVTATVTDDDTLSGTGEAVLVVGAINHPPTLLNLSADVVPEGSATTLTGTFTDPDVVDTHTVLIKWGEASPDTTLALSAGTLTFSVQHTYAVHGSYTATVTVTDAALASVSATLAVTVRNTPPANLALSPVTVVEGDEATLSGSFTDPDKSDTHSVLITWGDLSADTTLSLGVGVLNFSAKHTYATHGSYKATVKVTDLPANEFVTGTVDVTVLVRNTAPSNVTLSADTVVEGNPTTLTGSFSDPDTADSHSVLVKWGDGSADTVPVNAGVLLFSAKHTYATRGTYAVTATVTDPANASADGSTTATVLPLNHAPTDLKLSVDGIVEGGTATLNGTFTDLDASDTHTVLIDWGDGSSTTLALGAGVTTFSAQHGYATPRDYTLGAKVTDPSDASVSASITLTVRAKTAGELLDDLATLVHSWGVDAMSGKVDSARDTLDSSPDNTCNSLNALGNMVSAQTAKKIPMDQVDLFWSLMTKVDAAVPCSESGTVPNLKISPHH